MKRRYSAALALALCGCGTDTIVAVREVAQGGGANTGGATAVEAGAGGSASIDAGGPGNPPSGMPGFLHTSGAKIVDKDGKPVRIRAVSWYGMETEIFAPQGLWSRPLDDLLATITTLGFDTVRLPISSQLLDDGSLVSTSVSGGNPELVGMKGIDMLQHVVDRAGAHGLRVIIDRHDVAINEQPGLWYDNHYLASRLVSDWTTLAKRFYADDTVVAFELNANLAGTTTWGDDNPLTDWRLAAEKAGNAALLWNPDVLIIVDGIENAAGIRYIGGGNLAGARDAPVVLSSPDKLVYGAADFPPSAFTNAAQDQPWLTASSYPENLPGIWNEAWGYLVDDGRAVFLAEFGTAYATDSDKQWLGKLVPYLNDLGIGFGYWALNYGESHQAGLLDDAQWMTADPVKINAIEPLFE